MSRTINYLTAFLVFLLAVGSFVLSYAALWDTALTYGVPGRLAWIWPLLVDFALIVFSLAVVQSNLNNEPAVRRWAMVALYTVATVAFNVYHAPAHLVAQIVAVVAPISLFLSFETLMAMLKNGVIKRGIVQSLADLVKQKTQKEQELKDFEVKRMAEIEDKANKSIASAQEARSSWDDKILELTYQAEAKQIELIEAEGKYSQQISQLQDQIGTMERTIQSYEQDIESKRQELKQLEKETTKETIKLYLPANLTPEQKQDLVNRMSQEKLTQEQIAKALGVSVGTIKNIKKAGEVANNGRVK